MAVKVLHTKSTKQQTVQMHLARIERIIDDNSYMVGFLKKHPEGYYCWPSIEDKSTIERDEFVIIRNPTEGIVSAAGSRIVIIKLFFQNSDIEEACKELKIPMANVR